jgi:hypothetical protein
MAYKIDRCRPSRLAGCQRTTPCRTGPCRRAAPEMALLFKAKHSREKDIAGFQRVSPTMDPTRRSRLMGWLTQFHPGRPGGAEGERRG